MSIGVDKRSQFDALVRSSKNILVLTSKDPSNDALASVVTLVRMLRSWGKSSFGFISSTLPRAQYIVDLSVLRNNIDDYRDFVIDINLAEDQSIELLSNTREKGKQQLVLRSLGKQISSTDLDTNLGSFNFDLVITVGVSSLSKIDSVISTNPGILDGLHLINIDHHLNNEEFGSLNIVDTEQISTTQVLFNLILAYGSTQISQTDATAIYAGILANTNRFGSASTSSRAFKDAAQLVELGANVTDVAHCLFGDLEKFISKSAEDRVDNQDKQENRASQLTEPKTIELNKSSQASDEPNNTNQVNSNNQEDGLNVGRKNNMPAPLPIKEIIDKQQFGSNLGSNTQIPLADFAKPRQLSPSSTNAASNVSIPVLNNNIPVSSPANLQYLAGNPVQVAQNQLQNPAYTKDYNQPQQFQIQTPLAQNYQSPINNYPIINNQTLNPIPQTSQVATNYSYQNQYNLQNNPQPLPTISTSTNFNQGVVPVTDRPKPPAKPIQQWQKLSNIVNNKLSNNPLNQLQQMQQGQVPAKKKSLAEELLEIDKNSSTPLYGQY